MQPKAPPFRENGIPDGAGIFNRIHIAVALGKTVGRGQFLPGGGSSLVEGILQKLLLSLAHPPGHIDSGGGLVPNEVVPLLGLVVVEGVGHHVPEGHPPADAVWVGEYHAGLHDDPVFGAQVAVLILDVLRPLLQSFILAPARDRPAGAVASLCQTAQKVNKRVICLVDLINITGRDRLGLGPPHGGIVAVDPAGGPGIRVEVEHLLFLLIRDARLRLEFICSGHPPLVMTNAGIIGIDAMVLNRRAHEAGSIGTHGVVLHGIGVVPDDVASAQFPRPAVAPHYIERSAYYAPGVPILGAQVGDYALWELDQRESEECPLRIDRPGHICGAGFLAAGAAGIVGPHIAVAGRRGIGRGPVGLGLLGREHPQGDAGIGAVRPGYFIG